MPSLRNYPVDIYEQALERASFPSYDNFHNPNITFNDFINRLECVVNTIARFKTVRVKTTQASGLMKKLQARDIGVISYTKGLS